METVTASMEEEGWVASPVEEEGYGFVSTLRTQVGLFFQKGFGALSLLVTAVLSGSGGLSFTCLICEQGAWLWQGVLRPGGLFSGMGFLVPEEGQVIKERGLIVGAAVGSLALRGLLRCSRSLEELFPTSEPL
jgi:hypothetical protein